jgi:PDZ and LIM domain protein 5/6/7
MAQIAPPNPLQQDSRMSQVLPTVKCSSCSYPVPLDQLSDHVCAPILPRSYPSSTVASQTSPLRTLHNVPPPNAAHPSSRDTRSPLAIPSANQQDIRRQDSARFRNSPNPAPSRGAPSPAPSRNGVHSPGPSRTQSPFAPASSARQLIPRHSERDPDVIPDNLQPGRFRAPSNPRILPTLDTRSIMQRRPSAPLSPPSQGFQGAHDPRPALVPVESGHLVRSLTSSATSNHFMRPEIDTKSGGVAGMAGVGRRGFAAAAHAAMFAVSPLSRLESLSPMSPALAPWNLASPSSGQSMNGMRVDTPPLAVLSPSAGTSSFIHLDFRRARMHGCASWCLMVSPLSSSFNMRLMPRSLSRSATDAISALFIPSHFASLAFLSRPLARLECSTITFPGPISGAPTSGA